MSAERELQGRHAVVTGGGRGIGAAIARALAAEGAALTLLGRDRARLRDTAAQLHDAHGITANAVPCDVSDAESVADAFRAAREAHGEVDVLVNNAGQAEGSPFEATDRALWERMLAVNLTGAYLCMQQVLSGMRERRWGRVVTIASTSGLRGYRNVSAYTAAKHGVIGLTRAVAAEYVRAGITVNAICPGYTETDMAAAAVHNVMRDLQRSEAEARRLIAGTVQRGTLLQPEEIASAAAWLCSQGASGITGQALVVAGGEI